MISDMLIFVGGWAVGFLIVGGVIAFLSKEGSDYLMDKLLFLLLIFWTMLYTGIMMRIL